MSANKTVNCIKVNLFFIFHNIIFNEFLKIEDDDAGLPTDLLCVPAHYKDDLENVMIPYGLILDRYLFHSY